MSTERDARPESENYNPDNPSIRPGCQHFEVSPLDGPHELLHERGRHRLTISQEFFKEGERFSQLVGTDGANLGSWTRRQSSRV
jgi:hypothetical protein